MTKTMTKSKPSTHSAGADQHPISRRRAIQWTLLPVAAASIAPLATPARAALGPAGSPFTGLGKGGLLIQTPYGTRGDFELLMPDTQGVVHTLRRLNDQAGLPWAQAIELSIGSKGNIEGVAQIYSTEYQHVEVVVVAGGGIKTYWRTNTGVWNQYTSVPVTDAQGVPGFVQASLGAGLQFQVVVGLASGGMAHYYRDDANGGAWKLVAKFGTGQVKGVSLIQSNFKEGPNGIKNLALVAWVGNQLQCWEGGFNGWKLTGVFATGASGAPALIQGNWGGVGNYEVVVPVSSGGLASFWRNNDVAARPWNAFTKPAATGTYRAASLIQGYDGGRGNFELVALRGDAVDVFFRDDAPAWRSTTTLSPIFGGAPSQLGASSAIVETGVTGINTVLLKNGKVLMYGYLEGGIGGATIPACVWNPITNAIQTIPNFRNNFCSGQAPMANGKVLIVGGHVGATLKDVVVFNPDTNVATKVGDMLANRWYPTVTPLPDGRMLVMGGCKDVGWTNNNNNTWSIYDPRFGMGSDIPLPTPFSPHYPAGQSTMDLYPICFVLPSGQMLVHTRNTTRFFDLPSGSWTSQILKTVSNNSRTYPFMSGTAVLPLRPSENYRVRFVVSGGSLNTATVPAGQKQLHSDLTPASKTCEILDLGLPAPAWKSIAPMNIARLMADLVVLPDGRLLCVGGNALGHADQGRGATLTPELYDPATDKWTLMASLRVARGYHATGLLLPDGRVAITGKDADVQVPGLIYAETRVEIFSPPYLFKGARPVLGAVPAQVGFNQVFNVRLASGTTPLSVDRAVLVACGSATHQNNFTQRAVELVMTRGAGQLLLVSPPNANIAPPGFYMLFLIGTNGVPSVSAMVQVIASSTIVADAMPAYGSPKQQLARSLDSLGDAPRCSTTTADAGRDFDSGKRT
ncbi:MAG: DUF1929 domain-containing protein [Aquabacterium sp.]|nr:DUF1929 domain-containing protein [Aquabacterium sp.]